MTNLNCIRYVVRSPSIYCLPLFCGMFLAIAAPVRAGTIPTLFNTGVDSNGVVLADGAGDPHYTLTQSADTSAQGPSSFVTNQGAWPLAPGVWMPDSATSKWISPQADQFIKPDGTAGNTPGMYVYQTTFDLTGFDLSTVVINGNWATDNPGLAILLDGQDTGFSILHEPTYQEFHPFTLTSGFVQGINTLTFEVFNNPNPFPEPNPNPTGLRVEFVDIGSRSIVPEPSSIALMLVGLAGLAGFSRRRFGKSKT